MYVFIFISRRVHITRNVLDKLEGDYKVEPAPVPEKSANLHNEELDTYFIADDEVTCI